MHHEKADDRDAKQKRNHKQDSFNKVSGHPLLHAKESG
jgi:hypothetical protein